MLSSDQNSTMRLVADYLRQIGFPSVAQEVSIDAGGRTWLTDFVIYGDSQMQTPIGLVEVESALPAEVTILNPAVQQTFSQAAAMGSGVKFLLVSDGRRFHWFERSAEESS